MLSPLRTLRFGGRLGLPLVLCALAFLPVAGADTLSGLQPEDGQLLDRQGPALVERLYPMGPLRRIGGTLRLEGRVQVRGELASATWELPPDRSPSEAFKAARLALRAAGAQTLFWCEGRDCGESNLWANDIFANTRLLGSDDQQAFLLLRQPGTNRLMAVYGVLRGNRRAVLHVENLVADASLGALLPTPATLLRELREAGELAFPELGAPPNAEWAALLSRALNLDSTLRVRLSGQAAAAWETALVDAGVRANRLSVWEQPTVGLRLEIVR